jgi:hypothetical protein
MYSHRNGGHGTSARSGMERALRIQIVARELQFQWLYVDQRLIDSSQSQTASNCNGSDVNREGIGLHIRAAWVCSDGRGDAECHNIPPSPYEERDFKG